MKHVVVWHRVDTLGIDDAEVTLEPIHIVGDVVVTVCEAPSRTM